MGCNCKRVQELGKIMPETQVEETLLGKILRYFLKFFYFCLALIIAFFAIPVILVVIVYQLAFKDRLNITIPSFLTKYLEKQ